MRKRDRVGKGRDGGCNESLAANTVRGAFSTDLASDKSNEEDGGG
jgi:hypothetical protein